MGLSQIKILSAKGIPLFADLIIVRRQLRSVFKQGYKGEGEAICKIDVIKGAGSLMKSPAYIVCIFINLIALGEAGATLKLC